MTPALGDSIVAGDVLSRCHEHSLHVTGGNNPPQKLNFFSVTLYFAGIRRDGHLLFEVEMYLQKGCIMVSGVGSS